MALGGVEMGNIKAADAAKVTGAQISNNGTPISTATAAINGNKRPILTLRAVMYCLSNEFFAATAFTSNEHTDVCRRN